MPQLIRVTAATADVHSGVVDLTWQNVDNDGNVRESFATRQHFFTAMHLNGSPLGFSIAHLIQGRIEALERLACRG